MQAEAERAAVVHYLEREADGCAAGAEAARETGRPATRLDWIARAAALKEAASDIREGRHRFNAAEPSDGERWADTVHDAASRAVLHALRQAGPRWEPRLDAAVASALGWTRTQDAGWQPRRVYVFNGELRRVNVDGELPPFTASLDATVALVPSTWSWRVGNTPSGGFAVVGTHQREYHGATPALALCIALLEILHG